MAHWHVVTEDGEEFDVDWDVTDEGADEVHTSHTAPNGVAWASVTAPHGAPTPGYQWFVVGEDELGQRHVHRTARVVRVENRDDEHDVREVPEGTPVRPETPVVTWDAAGGPKELVEHEAGVRVTNDPREPEPEAEPADDEVVETISTPVHPVLPYEADEAPEDDA